MNEKIKRSLALFFAALLLVCMGVTAFAAEGVSATPVPSTGEQEIGGEDVDPEQFNALDPVSLPVGGSYKLAQGGTTYQVTLSWSGLSFTYHETTNGTWNTETHDYDTTTPAKWTSGDAGTSGSITLVNDSNGEVSSVISATMKSEVVGGNVRMRYSRSADMSGAQVVPYAGLQDTLGAAEGGWPGGTVTYYFLPNYEPTYNFGGGSEVQIGTITVTVKATE